MCDSTSAAKSSFERSRNQRVHIASPSVELGTEHERDGFRQPPPIAGFFRELFAAGGGELVEARTSIVVGNAPLGTHPTRGLEALERRIERSVIDEQRALRRVLNRERDTVPVVRSEREGAQDQKIECALEERRALAVGFSRHSTR